MSTYDVPYGIKVSVTIRHEEDGNKYVDVHAPLYKRKEWTMSHCYADTYTDAQILKDYDFITVMLNHYKD
jgi:hypothetical protein